MLFQQLKLNETTTDIKLKEYTTSLMSFMNIVMQIQKELYYYIILYCYYIHLRTIQQMFYFQIMKQIIARRFMHHCPDKVGKIF